VCKYNFSLLTRNRDASGRLLKQQTEFVLYNCHVHQRIACEALFGNTLRTSEHNFSHHRRTSKSRSATSRVRYVVSSAARVKLSDPAARSRIFRRIEFANQSADGFTCDQRIRITNTALMSKGNPTQGTPILGRRRSKLEKHGFDKSKTRIARRQVRGNIPRSGSQHRVSPHDATFLHRFCRRSCLVGVNHRR